MLQQKYAPRGSNAPLSNISGLDPSLMPPCNHVLIHKIKRAHYVTKTWKCAHESCNAIGNPADNGWSLQDDIYVIKWYDCQQVPQSLSQEVEDNVQNEDVEDIEYNSGSDESDVDDEQYDLYDGN